ncbi:hypothetical protein GMSM_22690 [Geomonas sp. Red276]
MPKLHGTFTFISLLLLLLIARGSWAGVPARHEVRINGIVVGLQGEEPAVPALPQAREEKGARAWIVKFSGPIHPEQKAEVERLGCRLTDYLPEFAFRAVMDDGAREAIARLPYIEGTARFQPAFKLHERLRGRHLAPPAGEKVTVHLTIDDPAQLKKVLATVQRKGGEVLDVGPSGLRVTVAAAMLAELAQLEEVSWIDEHAEMELLNDTTAWVIQGNVPERKVIWDRNLHGEGQIIGVGDSGLDYDMPWFRDPAGAPVGPTHRKLVGYSSTYGDDYDADNPGHGTHVCGTLGGDRTPVDGATTANGMAPKARIFLQDLTAGASSYVYPPSDLGLLFSAAYNAGARLHTNSWGSGTNTYGPFAASADRFLWEHPDFVALFANGNSGPASGTVGEPATAKNVVSVGATYNGSGADNLATFSSNGPTADGRIKPTVTAPGYQIVSADSDGVKGSYNSGTITMSGTSMATPAVAGAAALIRQYFTDGYYPDGFASPSAAFIPSAALIRAVLINSAREMTGTSTDGTIPSTGQGWGRITLDDALFFAGEGKSLQVADETAGLDTGGSWIKDIPVADGSHPFKVTLAWSDYPGATGASKALVNDLDLTVTGPDGSVYPGNAFIDGASVAGGTPDRLNVEEQVLIKAPAAGVYRVAVTAYNVPMGPQPFALAVTGVIGPTPRGGIVLDRKFYASGGEVNIRVVDRDLDTDPARAEQVTVLLLSGSEPAGERVLLTESGPASAIFTGRLPLAPGTAVPNDGRLQVSGGDTITAVYHDGNDGTGNPATATATATVDDVPPVLSAAAVTAVTDTGGVVGWNSDEPANSVVDYGDTQTLGANVTDRTLVLQHRVVLSSLKEATAYYLAVSSSDEAGNVTSIPLTLTTRSLPPELTATSSEGNNTTLPATLISGVATDPSGVSQVTVNGTVVAPRAGDGYFSLTVNLAIGDNPVLVTATDTLGNMASVSLDITRLPPVDLAMQSVAGPSQATQNAAITVTDTVCNAGPGSATGFLVAFYLSTDVAVSSDDVFLGSRSVATLAAGGCSSGSTPVTVPALTRGGSYYLLAYADYTNRQTDNNRGNNTAAGNTITLTAPQLGAPTSLTVPGTNSTGSIKAAWAAGSVGGVTYQLEYSKDGAPYTVAATVSGTVATVNVTANGSYTFRVKAKASGYTDSPYSATATCLVALTCDAPTGLTVPVTSSTGTIKAAWAAGSVSGTTYRLEYSKDGGPYTAAYIGTATVAMVTVPAGGSYTFRVKAMKSGYADSPYSATATCLVTLTCGPPTSLTVPATNSTGSIKAAWAAGSVSGTTYQLEYSRNGGAYTVAATVTTTVVMVTVTANGTYTFRVKAMKSGYADSPYSATSSCTVTLACGMPAPIVVPATSSTGSVKVAWGTSNVSGVTYQLQYSKDGGPYTAAYSGTATVAIVTVPASGTYVFRVKAVKSGYADSPWNVSSAVVVTKP